MKQINILILFLFPLLTCPQQSSQRIFITGYIVMVSGDTVYGKLAMFNTEESCDHVIFKRDTSQTEENINAKEVKLYNRGLEFYYSRQVIRPNWLGNKDNFVKPISRGKVRVYRYNCKQEYRGHLNHITEYYLEKEQLI